MAPLTSSLPRPVAGRPATQSPRRRPGAVRPSASLVDAPAPGAAPPAAPTASPPRPPAAAAESARASFFKAAAGLGRGASATPAERAAVERAVSALEALPTTDGTAAAPPLARAAGTWRLAYSSVEPFRSSPFFWGFAAAVPASSAIFAFTDAIPGAEVGVARQVIDLPAETGEEDGQSGTLRSDVTLTVATLLTGSVVTTARLARVPDGDGGGLSGTDLDVRLVDTRVERSSIAPGLVGRVAVPVGEVFGRLQGGGGTAAPPPIRLKVSYCDDVLRVARVEAEGSLFVYVRE